MSQRRHIYLTGFMGSGKSTVGKDLAAQLGYPFIDVDDEIEKAFGQSIKKIFETKGEPWYRVYEESFVSNLSATETASVISLGGGALISKKSQEVVKENGILIYLQASPAEIWRRSSHSTRRPLMRQDGEEWSKEDYFKRIDDLLKTRLKGYRTADLTINRDHTESDEVAQMIISILQKANLIEA